MPGTDPVTPPVAPDHQAVTLHYTQLLDACSQTLAQSLTGTGAQAQAASHAFVRDIETWIEAIQPRREVVLLRSAGREYQYALLALVLGQYREAFSALRLFLELSAAAVFYSSHELLLREWLAGRRDNNWRRITHTERGVFSFRFADAFCPSIREYTQQYRTIAVKVYRECSQYVHANALTAQGLPPQHAYDADLFYAWHARARSAWLTVSFLLYSRYYSDLSVTNQRTLEATLQDQLGHIEQVRDQLALLPTPGQ